MLATRWTGNKHFLRVALGHKHVTYITVLWCLPRISGLTDAIVIRLLPSCTQGGIIALADSANYHNEGHQCPHYAILCYIMT